MNKNGPIIIIEDDLDDQELLFLLYKEMNYTNELVFLDNGDEGLRYLKSMSTLPFLIISDMNMPKINGMELRALVQKNAAIRSKCIPYIILSTTATKDFVDNAYALGVHGYFKKPTRPADWRIMMRSILEYWSRGLAPGM
jgi:CheY-like chemotaxis protein